VLSIRGLPRDKHQTFLQAASVKQRRCSPLWKCVFKPARPVLLFASPFSCQNRDSAASVSDKKQIIMGFIEVWGAIWGVIGAIVTMEAQMAQFKLLTEVVRLAHVRLEH